MSLFDEAMSQLNGSSLEADRLGERHRLAVTYLVDQLNEVAPEFVDAVRKMSEPPKNARQARAKRWKVCLWLGSKNADSTDPKVSVNIVFEWDGTWRWASHTGVPDNVPPSYQPNGLSEIDGDTVRSDVRSELLRFLTGKSAR